MTLRRLVALAACGVACKGADSPDASLPYQTTFTTINDTVVASTIGDVPDSLLRSLVVEWRASNDSLGDVGSIAVAPDGKVWVWDGTTPALFRFDTAGKLIGRVGRRGSGPGEYQRVNDIAVARDGALVMWDEGNTRLNIYNNDGTFRTSAKLGFSNCCGQPVMVDTTSRIWLKAYLRSPGRKDKPFNPTEFGKPETVAYLRFDSTGTPLDTLIPPTLPGEDAHLTSLNVSSTSMGGRMRQVPYGTYPMAVASPLGHVVLAMSRPYALHTESAGQHFRLTREFTSVPIDETERAQERDNISFDMRQVRSDWTWNGPEIPREKPPIYDIMVGLDGRIWVQLSVSSEPFEPDTTVTELNPFSGARQRPPAVKFRPKEKRWDVFEPDGRYFGRILLPRSIILYVARGNQVWGVIRDEDDVPTVVRMRVEPTLDR